MKDKHKEHLLIAGSIASIVALGYLIYRSKQQTANAQVNGDVVAMDTPIPVFSWSNIGGSSTANGTLQGQQTIGNSAVTDTPVGGQIPYSINYLQASGGQVNDIIGYGTENIAPVAVQP